MVIFFQIMDVVFIILTLVVEIILTAVFTVLRKDTEVLGNFTNNVYETLFEMEKRDVEGFRRMRTIS